MNEPTLRAWLDTAWTEHATQPRPVADGLLTRAAALPDDADGAEAVRLAEHVLLAHLNDADALQRLLARMPAHAALQPSVRRARWALATLAGQPAPDLPAAPRWRALHSVVMALVQRGELGAARDRLFADEATAAAHDEADARKAYAASAHNTALDLRLGPRGDPARDALMIDAAQLERRAWQAAGGTWMNTERADYQLAMCHAVLGQGAPAQAYAQACLACCEAEGAEASERFFAHECNVHACRAAGDTAGAARHREHMAACLAQVDDDAMKAWCAKTLAST